MRERERVGERIRDRKRAATHWFTPKMPTRPELSQGRSWGRRAQSMLAMWVQALSHLDHHCCIPERLMSRTGSGTELRYVDV